MQSVKSLSALGFGHFHSGRQRITPDFECNMSVWISVNSLRLFLHFFFLFFYRSFLWFIVTYLQEAICRSRGVNILYSLKYMQLGDMEAICCEWIFSLNYAPINHSAFEERSQRKSLLSGATAAKIMSLLWIDTCLWKPLSKRLNCHKGLFQQNAKLE